MAKREVHTKDGVIIEDYESKKEKLNKDIDLASSLADIKAALKTYFNEV